MECPTLTLIAAGKVILGDYDDFSISGSPLMFGSGANFANCVTDETLCAYFNATQDTIKEYEEIFKLNLTAYDEGVHLCSDKAHVSIPVDDSDGMLLTYFKTPHIVSCTTLKTSILMSNSFEIISHLKVLLLFDMIFFL